MSVFDDLEKVSEYHCAGMTGAELASHRANGIELHSVAIIEDVQRQWFINFTLSNVPDRRFSLCLHDSMRIKTYVQVKSALEYVMAELDPINPIVVYRQRDSWPATNAFL
ncbi:MAG: hypothetical protein AAF692_02265 [Pseudomonadota bacterium]